MIEDTTTFIPTIILAISAIFSFFAIKIPHSFFESKRKWLYAIVGFTLLFLTPIVIWLIETNFYCEHPTSIIYSDSVYLYFIKPLVELFYFVGGPATIVAIVVFIKGLINKFRKKPAKWYFVWSIGIFIFIIMTFGFINVLSPTISGCDVWDYENDSTRSASTDVNWGLE